MLKVSSASLKIFIDTLNCVLEDRVQYITVQIPNVFCDGHLQILKHQFCNCQVHRDILITLYYYTRGMAWLLVYVIITLLRNNKLMVQLLRTSLCVGPNCKGDSLRFYRRLELDLFFEMLSEMDRNLHIQRYVNLLYFSALRTGDADLRF